MNASSKYANLPFIASGEKDVYETEDLPEADQIGIQQKIYDSSIEIIPSSSIDAFNKFAIADVQKTFEDDNKPEASFIERYKRIQAEIEELKKSAQSQEACSFSKEVENLFINLENLHDVCFKKVDVSQLVKDIRKEKPTDPENPLIYELYRKPDKEEVLELARLNALEQRLKKIETTLGLNDAVKDSNYSLLNSYLKDQSIMNIVVNLSNKILQLDNSSLDRIDARLHLISEKLNQIQDKKSSLTELDKEDKLNEIYNFYVKIDQNRSLIPNVLERVQVLNEMQDQASKFSNTLNAMENIQNEIKTSLDNNNQNLKNLKEIFEKIQNIEKIVDDFQKRLEKIK